MTYNRDTMRLLKPPFTHQHGYIFDDEGPWLDACRREGDAWVCRKCGEEGIES